MLMSRFLSTKESPAREMNPTGAIIVRSSSPRKLYSTFADQLGAKAHSMPAPTSQPLLLLLEPVIDAPVVRLVTVKSSLPTQPPPALTYKSQGPFFTPNRAARVVIHLLLEVTWMFPTLGMNMVPLLLLFETPSKSASIPRT